MSLLAERHPAAWRMAGLACRPVCTTPLACAHINPCLCCPRLPPQSVTHYNDPVVLAEVSADLGEAMVREGAAWYLLLLLLLLLAESVSHSAVETD